MNKENIRVRFAPAPTGYLHVGSAHTALFNYLFAKHNQGKFILRIEDTDLERSKPEFEKDILESLNWLGISWDEGPNVGGEFAPYKQSERIEIYQKYIKILKEKELIYPCYCTEEELEERRKLMLKRKQAPRYEGNCRNLTKKERSEKEEQGRKPAWRFKVKDEELTFFDLIHGEVKFDLSLFGDFIIVKSDGIASFLLAGVIDDTLMEITHVIRGDDHLSNTPRQILLYQALDFPLAKFAHHPMILAPDRSKLSKRFGAVSLSSYKEMGYLPEAMLNFLSLLGWTSEEKDKEIFSQEELISSFTLERLAKSGAIFDIKKLNWMNNYYLRIAELSRITEFSLPYFKKQNLYEKALDKDKDWWYKVIDIGRESANNLSEIPDKVKLFFEEEIDKEVYKKLEKYIAKMILEKLKEEINNLKDFNLENINLILKNLPQELNMEPKKVYPVIRLILTGKESGPELYKIIFILGKKKTIELVNKFILGEI